MNENDVRKCKKCGATLVGKKSHKLGLCSSCVRELAQGGAAVTCVVIPIIVGVVKFVTKKR